MKASEPFAARWEHDSFQHLEEPAERRSRLRAPLSTADSARPAPAGAHRGQQPRTAGRVCRTLAPCPPSRRMPRANPRARPRSPPHGPSGWRCVSSPEAPQSPAQSPPGRGCGCSEPALTAIDSSRPRRRQGESSKPWGSAAPSLAHLPRGSTARLETLANSHLQQTRLKIRPKPGPLQLSDFIQNSPHQLKPLKHPCRVHTPRRGHSEMYRFHRESSVFPSSCAAQPVCYFLLACGCSFPEATARVHSRHRLQRISLQLGTQKTWVLL